MSRITILAAALVIALSCDNELVTTAPPVDIPVVFGILSPVDNTHYLRVERAFLQEGVDAVQLASDPDVIYYDGSTSVRLRRISNDDTIELERIDGREDGIEREVGPFAGMPNILYKFRNTAFPILPGEEYELIVERPEPEPLVTSRAIIVPSVTLASPRPSNTNRQFSAIPGSRIEFDLSSSLDNVAIIEYIVMIRLRERNLADGSSEDITIEWEAVPGFTDNGVPERPAEIKIDALSFFNVLNSSLEESRDLQRRFLGIDVYASVGSEPLAEYQRILNANSGLTGAEDVPVYTNIEGGRGVFASRFTRVETDFFPSPTTFDSLKTNSLTRNLNFVQ